MRVGTKSLLFGAHQFIWHPFTVFLAWHELYGMPNWKELVCIIIHDLGYWGCPNMEGEEGTRHPQYAGFLAWKYLDEHRKIGAVDDDKYHHYRDMCWYHSRTSAARHQREPSNLCWADKLCVKFDPWWLYLPRVWLSGEFIEYRQVAANAELFPLSTPDKEWYDWARERMIRKAHSQDARPPYQEGS